MKNAVLCRRGRGGRNESRALYKSRAGAHRDLGGVHGGPPPTPGHICAGTPCSVWSLALDHGAAMSTAPSTRSQVVHRVPSPHLLPPDPYPGCTGPSVYAAAARTASRSTPRMVCTTKTGPWVARRCWRVWPVHLSPTAVACVALTDFCCLLNKHPSAAIPTQTRARTSCPRLRGRGGAETGG